MVMSMTGFGRHEQTTEDYKISVEIKSVNHRYLDLNIKMPKRFNCFESGMRTLLKRYIQRGKVDIFISYEDYRQKSAILHYNPFVAAEYMGCFQKMGEDFKLQNDIKVSDLSKCPEVLTMEQPSEDEDQIWMMLSGVMETAAQEFVRARSEEGEHLKADLIQKLAGIGQLVLDIEERSPLVLDDYRTKLEDKVKELLADTSVEESRIAAEVIIYADKICVDEETVRLKSHIKNAQTELENNGSIGRKLDFIAQEMNREANTILSKANDMTISEKAIALKTEIEKVREQIQNIE